MLLLNFYSHYIESVPRSCDSPGNSFFLRSLTHGRVDGTDSYYIVYSTTNYGEGVSSTRSTIVDSQANVNFKFSAQSIQGWDKIGITLLEHSNYQGTGVTCTYSESDITTSFPVGHIQGARSFIVMKGVWALYTGKHNGGT